MNDEKLNILKTLIVDEEHTLEDLKRLVEKSKPFLKIENKTGKIIISPEFLFTISEKIIVYLIGIYFSKELGLNQEIQITSRLISENINVVQTSMSSPFGEYVRTKVISLDNNSYSIKFYEIEKQLDYLTEKYLINNNEQTISTSKERIRPIKKKQSSNKKIPKIQSQKIITHGVDEESLKNELAKYNLTTDSLNSVINLVNDGIMLLRGWHGSSDSESHVRSTLLYLTVNRLLYGLEEVDSSELRMCLLNAGVEMKNHSTTLKSYSTYIIHKRGPIGSTNTSYRITPLGFQKGIILLKDIIENTSNFDIQFKNRVKSGKADKISIDDEKLNKNIIEFAKQNKLNEERLRTLFDFQKEGVRICMPLRENTRKIMQIKTIMLLAGLLRKIYDIKSFDGKTLLKNSRTSCDRLDLLDSNKYYKIYFSVNKSKSAMELTYAGENKSIELLKSYLEKEDCEL